MKNKGFTLVEVLIATSLIVVMSAIVLLNYNKSGNQMALERSAAKLAQDIRRVQGMALSAKEIPGAPANFEYGFGIHFNIAESDDSYVIFADKNNNRLYDSGEEIESPAVLPNGITIGEISPAPLDVVFSPPDPKVWVNGASADSQIALSVSGQLREINVSSSGLVSVSEVITIQCSLAVECDDGNVCTDDVCLNPGTTGSSCQSSPKTNGTDCGGSRTCQSGICSECVLASDCQSLYGSSCDYGTCDPEDKPVWTCSAGNCSYPSCSYDPTCVTNQPKGEWCTQQSNCASGLYCTDGYCCESSCSGSCQTCAAIPGTCTLKTADDECSICMECDGFNANCQNVPSGQEGNGCPNTCKQCSGGSCININNAEDTTGSNQWFGACRYCSAGSPITITCAQENYGLAGNTCTGGSVCNNSGTCQTKIANGSSCDLFGCTPQCPLNNSCLFCASGWCRSTDLCGTQIYAPTVINTVVTNITKSAAILNGQVSDTGNENPTVTIYWGDNDGGTTPGNWDFSSNLGTQSGNFSKNVTGLLSSTLYRYRTYAQNSAGGSWASSTASFTTAPPTETISPTLPGYSGGTKTTNPTYAYDGNVNTGSVTLYGYNLNPSISYGTAWQAKNYPWTSATLYVTLERQVTTGGDLAGVEISPIGASILSLGGTAFPKQEVPVPLNANDWGGVGFPSITDLLRVNIRDMKTQSSDAKNVYIYEIKIIGNVSD